MAIPKFFPKWIFQPPVDIPSSLRDGLAGSDFLLESLARRGITDPKIAASFLDFRKYAPSPPSALPGLEAAVERIAKSVEKHEVIGVWGDFDVDGQTATAVLVSTLRKIGADVQYHVPVRSQESHGVCIAALKAVIAPSLKLLITCDTGISALESAAFLKSSGIDLIVTDHHQLPEQLPDAYAIVNPQFLPAGHPLHELAGVGVAYKLAEALLLRFDLAEIVPPLHDLVALGSIADLAMLSGDTRYLVQSGLDRMHSAPRLFLVKMAERLELPLDLLDEEHIGFFIAPRLNAVGRLDDANPMVDFLMSENEPEVMATLNQMEALNARRRLLVSQVFQGCLAQLEANPSLFDQSILILAHPEWPAGVVGIAAGRLAEYAHRPVILLTGYPEGVLRGSARSVGGIDITSALVQNQNLLLSFGGHPMAAGLSLLSSNLAEFRARMNQTVSAMAEAKHIEPELQIETTLNLDQVNFDLLSDLNRLAPFGQGNLSPVFAAPGLTLKDASILGHSGEHRQVIVGDPSGEEFRILWWQSADLPLPEGRFDLAYSVQMNIYKGKPQVQYVWVDYQPSQETASAAGRKLGNRIELIDRRKDVDLTPELKKTYPIEKALIWREGSHAALPGNDRTLMQKSDFLVIQTVPPSSRLLLEVVASVKPTSILFLGELPQEDNLGFFLKELGRFIKQTADRGSEEYSIVKLAARFAATSEMVLLGLQWFAAMGRVTLAGHTSEQIHISPGGNSDPEAAAAIQADLKRRADEISAFRRYYLAAPLESLIDLRPR